MNGSQVFVDRLTRLCRLRVEYLGDLNEAGIKLMDRAIKATVQDCADFGRSAEAWEIFLEMQQRLEVKQ